MIADVTHLVKAIRNGLWKWKTFRLPAELVKKLGLPTDLVNFAAFERVYELDKGNQLKIAHHLTEEVIHPVGQFSKMRVRYAVSLLSHDTASAIRLCVSQNLCPIEDLTTAYFCEQVSRWYRIVSSRNERGGFNKDFPIDLEDKISFLNFFTFELICELEVEPGVHGWKPWQRGIALSTKSYLGLQEIFLNELYYLFLKGGRLTSEGVENLFSMIRSFNPIPSGLAAIRILKSISLTQHFKAVKCSSYEADDHTGFLTDLADFRELETQDAESNVDDDFQVDIDNLDIPELDFMEQNSLYYFGGYIIKKTVAGKVKCNACYNYYVKKETDDVEGTTLLDLGTLLTMFKSYGRLICLTDSGYDLFMVCEQMFRLREDQFYGKKYLGKSLTRDMVAMLPHNYPDIPSCHSSIIIRRFVKARLLFWAKFKSQKLLVEQEDLIVGEANSSKTMKFRCAVK
jgi:hypothetical protein